METSEREREEGSFCMSDELRIEEARVFGGVDRE